VPDLQSAAHLLIDDRKRNHLLLACGPLALQLLIEGADLLSGPVRLDVIIRGITDISASIDKLAVLRKLLAPGRKRRLQPNGWSARTLRLRDALIALDGRAAGASHRDVATVIFGKNRVASDWPDPALKDRVRRSLSRGEVYANGGYRTLMT
jgi:hypothetical protein